MIRTSFLLLGIIGLATGPALADDATPRGSLLELHSCEVFAGGCIVSSEAPQSARYMLRAWDFTGGSFDHTDLAGLKLAVLQVSPDNLAAEDSRSGRAVIYLPASATSLQRKALVKWLRTSQPDFHPSSTRTRILPLHFTRSCEVYSLIAGNSIFVETRPFTPHEIFTCGETLWYQPRTPTSLFTVVVDQSSRISEPLLELKWDDHAKRSIFLGRFGEPVSARNLYVSLKELYGASKAVF